MAYSPYPPPRKADTPAWVWLLVAAGVIVAVLVFFGGCAALLSSASDEHSTSSSSTTTTVTGSHVHASSTALIAPTTTAPTSGRMNNPIPDGGFATFTVDGLETGVPAVGEYFIETAQGIYTIITVTVSNTSNRSIRFTTSQQHVRDASNRQFQVDDAATFMANDDTSWVNEVNPGNSVTVRLVFDMPRGVAATTISLRASGGRPVSVALQ